MATKSGRSLGRMRARHLLSLATIVWCTTTTAQAVQHKHLLTGFGAGAGVLHMHGTPEGSLFDATDLPCGAVRFAFGYAFADRWSIGLHYDRVGSAEVAEHVDRVRLTTYQLEGAYRPWIGNKATLETHLALGVSLAALTPEGGRLPYRARTGVYTIGARYIHMFGEVLGGYVALDHSASGQAAVDPPDDRMEQASTEEHMDWQADRLSVGLLIRF